MNKRSVGIALSYVNSFLNLVTGLFLSSFLLRQTGAVDYGIYQTVSSFVNYLVLLEFGTGTVMVRNISLCRSKNASEEEIHKNISTVWSICIMLSTLILAVAVAFYFSFDAIYSKSMTGEQIAYGKNIFIFAAVNLVISFVWQTLKSVALAFEDYTFSSKQSIVKIIIRTVVLLFAVSFVKKSIVIAAVDALLGVVIAGYTYIYCVKKFKIRIDFSSFDKLILKAALPLCLAVFLQAILNQAHHNVAKFIIGVKMLPEIVSLYSVALYIESMYTMLTSLPVGMYAPQTAMVMTKADGDYTKITDYLAQPGRLIAIVGGTVTFGFVAAGRPFVNILYGNQYESAFHIALILMVPAMLYKLTAPAMNVLDVLNKRMSRSVILVFTAVLNIILTIWWIDLYGIMGAAVATSVSAVIGQFLVMNIYYSKAIGIKMFRLYKKSFSGILIYQLLGAVAGYLVSEAIKNIYASFVLSGIVYILVAFGGYVLFGLNEAEKNKRDAIIAKLLRK